MGSQYQWLWEMNVPTTSTERICPCHGASHPDAYSSVPTREPTPVPTPVECRRRLLERRRAMSFANFAAMAGAIGDSESSRSSTNDAGNTRSTNDDDADAGMDAFAPLTDDEADFLDSCERWGAEQPQPPRPRPPPSGGTVPSEEAGNGGPSDTATTPSCKDVLEECERDRGPTWSWTCSDARLQMTSHTCSSTSSGASDE